MSSESSENVQFQWDVKIPLRDGVHLNAMVYRPKDQGIALPCICVVTPYIGDSYHDRAVFFASHGLPFAIVDSRGRGNSEGTFDPCIQEAKDGYDVVEWLARQGYCDGKVGMWGGSYNGYVQWATAKEHPPHLATIVPVASLCPSVDFPMRNNVHYPYVLQWLTYTNGHALQSQVHADNTFWGSIWNDWLKSGDAFRDIDLLVLGRRSSLFQSWLAHPEPDSFWDAYNPTDEQYARLQIPVLTITGSYDDDQPGALEHYKRHTVNPFARERHYLVIGPWDHAGTRTPRCDFAGLKFGAESLIDLPLLHREWYAWTMQDGPKPAFLRGLVAYYVMGAERWRYTDSLEAATSHHETFFLDSRCNANDVLGAGSMGRLRGMGEPDSYVYDPADSDGLEIEAERNRAAGSVVDQRVIFALRGKALVYHSAPFERDTEITGFFGLSAWISIDCVDTDLYASVHEIGIDGTSIRLSADVIRARYREGLRTPKLIQTTEPLRYDFQRFTFVSRQIARGHRLRLVIAPMGYLNEATFAERNFNGGGVVANESRRDGRAVTVRLFHDAIHPSALSVPFGQSTSIDEPVKFSPGALLT